MLVLNPIALRKAKIVCNIDLSECSRVKVNCEANLSHPFFSSLLNGGQLIKERIED